MKHVLYLCTGMFGYCPIMTRRVDLRAINSSMDMYSPWPISSDICTESFIGWDAD